MILTIRTDKPEAELGLYDGGQQISYETWQAHRQLAETIHNKIKTLLHDAGKEWADITGVVAYKGPGSFTGLRIGLSVANAIASSYKVPVIGTTNDTWIEDGIAAILDGKGSTVALPEYGVPVHITQPKK